MSGRADIAVVGGGPAGLSAAVNALARGKTVRLLSSGKTNLKHAENVDNYLGFYKITGGELMDRFEEHAAALGISERKLNAAGRYFTEFAAYRGVGGIQLTRHRRRRAETR